MYLRIQRQTVGRYHQIGSRTLSSQKRRSPGERSVPKVLHFCTLGISGYTCSLARYEDRIFAVNCLVQQGDSSCQAEIPEGQWDNTEAFFLAVYLLDQKSHGKKSLPHNRFFPLCLGLWLTSIDSILAPCVKNRAGMNRCMWSKRGNGENGSIWKIFRPHTQFRNPGVPQGYFESQIKISFTGT